VTPRAGAVAEGRSTGVMYLLLDPVKGRWSHAELDFEEDCWRCVKLLANGFAGCRDDSGEVCLIREAWLREEAGEP